MENNITLADIYNVVINLQDGMKNLNNKFNKLDLPTPEKPQTEVTEPFIKVLTPSNPLLFTVLVTNTS